MGMSTGGGDESGLMSEINVTPFVDVMLVLLIIFMVTTPMMTMGMNVELPRSDAPSMDVPDDLVVLSITADGKYYITMGDEDRELSPEQMSAVLTESVKNQPNRSYYLKADGQVPYEKVAQLMALATRAGVPRVGMVTQPGSGIGQ
jgi:biopolymer transport protein TolR